MKRIGIVIIMMIVLGCSQANDITADNCPLKCAISCLTSRVPYQECYSDCMNKCKNPPEVEVYYNCINSCSRTKSGSNIIGIYFLTTLIFLLIFVLFMFDLIMFLYLFNN